MNIFLLKVLIVKKSQKLRHVQFSHIHTSWGINISFEKLGNIRNKGMNLRNTLVALICFCGRGLHGKSVAWGQVNRQRLEETMYVPLWDLEDQRGRGFLNLSFRGKGKSHKQEELLWGTIKKLPKELTTELLYLELPTISASRSVKRYMHYIRFLLTKT